MSEMFQIIALMAGAGCDIARAYGPGGDPPEPATGFAGVPAVPLVDHQGTLFEQNGLLEGQSRERATHRAGQHARPLRPWTPPAAH